MRNTLDNYNRIYNNENMNLLEIGKTNNIERDKFISRFFGIFNEDIALIYFMSPYSKYNNLGRPTIKKELEKYTLDFTLQDKNTNEIFICEMKCEIQYQNYKRLELNNKEQIKLHKKNAFIYFLDIANNMNNYVIEINKKIIKINGIILLWGKVTNDCKIINDIKDTYNIKDILSLENMINIMIDNNYQEYYNYIFEKKEWLNTFIDYIGAKNENIV